MTSGRIETGYIIGQLTDYIINVILLFSVAQLNMIFSFNLRQ